MYKGQLEQGIARSVFNQEDSFVKGITENFKPFKKFTKEQLQFGFKVEFEGVKEKMGDLPITPLVKGMEKGWIDNVKVRNSLSIKCRQLIDVCINQNQLHVLPTVSFLYYLGGFR